jgi:RimJ/RimL family protein N-acetyltransferase
VQLKCDGRNEASRRAIEALGAVYEGTLRQHDEVWDGHMRDAAVFSILESEWPDVRDALDARLDGLNKR